MKVNPKPDLTRPDPSGSTKPDPSANPHKRGDYHSGLQSFTKRFAENVSLGYAGTFLCNRSICSAIVFFMTRD